jgi:glycosyltransferase involved in cell wall biosynthesis
MMKLTILYICYEDISGYNGAIRHVTEIIKGLSRNRHHIDLCVPKLGKKPPVLNETPNIRLRHIPTLPVRIGRPLSYLFVSLLYLPWLYLWLRPDIVYIRDIKFTVLPVFLAKMCKVPSILEVNGLADEAEKIRKVGAWTVSVLNAFHRWNLRNADRIVTVTRGIKREMVRRYGVDANKISIITNGVDLRRFRPIKREEASKRAELSRAYKYIGFVGGLFPWHGLDHLVAAAPHILQEEPLARFVIVGSGLMEARLKAMVARRQVEHTFIFTGSVPFDAVPDYINSFDVCAVFFKRVRKDPGDPIKLYEYLACGRPVVASNVMGYGDVVTSIGAGISVDSEDPIATARGILKLFKNRTRAEKMGRKGFEKAQTCFGWEKKVEESEQVMRELIRSCNFYGVKRTDS